jgi:hypothetical protein
MDGVSKAEFRTCFALIMLSFSSLIGGDWGWLFMTAWLFLASFHATSFVKEIWRSR